MVAFQVDNGAPLATPLFDELGEPLPKVALMPAWRAAGAIEDVPVEHDQLSAVNQLSEVSQEMVVVRLARDPSQVQVGEDDRLADRHVFVPPFLAGSPHRRFVFRSAEGSPPAPVLR